MAKSLTIYDDEPIKKKKKKKMVDDEPVKKKKKAVVEDPPKKKKKKRIEAPDDEIPPDLKSLNLPMLKGSRTGISKIKSKKMRSIIGDSAEDIQQLLEVGDSDSASMMIYKRALQALIDLVPYAEHNIRESKGRHGVYQINSLIQSIRELLIDIQGANDRGAVGERLIEKIMRPSFLDIGMALMQEFASVATEVKPDLNEKQYDLLRAALKSSQERIGGVIQKQFFDVKEKTREAMQR